MNGSPVYVALTVSPLHDPEALRGLLLITFTAAAPQEQETHRKGKDARPGRVKELERELHYVKESLQRTVEELEASNEELRSTNEELQSTNEELQSTNEELETSKEELQSLNEELNTLNSELQSKVEQLSEANDDMENFLNGTDVATVFVDEEACVKRYTEKARKLINLIPTDIGRPIGDLVTKVSGHELLVDLERVLRSRQSAEREVQTETGGWYTQRILPYQTSEGRVNGAVITFSAIERQKEAERAIEVSRELYESIAHAARDPVLILDRNLRVVFANRAFREAFKTTAKRSYGKSIYEIDGHRWDRADIHRLLERQLAGRKNADFDFVYDSPKKSPRKFKINVTQLEQISGTSENLVLTMIAKEV
jgi:two-component system CheB/CheR fusion protein